MPALNDNAMYELASAIEPREGKEVTLSPELANVLAQHNPSGKKESMREKDGKDAKEKLERRELTEPELEVSSTSSADILFSVSVNSEGILSVRSISFCRSLPIAR